MKLRSYLWLFILICGSLPSHAQDMSELVELALQNNLSLKSSESRINAIEAKAGTVVALPDPEVGIGAFPLPVETRLGAQLFRLSLVQMFPWPGLTESRIHSINVESEIESSRWDEKKNLIAFQVRSAYMKMYELVKSERILKNDLAILNDLKGLIEGDIRSGKKSTADAILIDARILKVRSDIEVLQKDIQKVRIELNDLIDQPISTEIVLDEELSFFNPDPAYWEMVKEESLSNPSLAVLNDQMKWIDSELHVNDLNGAPSFGLGIDYIAVADRNDVEIENNGRDIVQLKAMVRLPIYRRQYRSREQQLLKMKESFDFAEQDVRSSLLAGIEELRYEFEIIQKRYSQYQDELTLINDALEIMEVEYSVDARDITELLQLERERVRLELNTLKELVKSRMVEIKLKKIYFE